MDHDTELRDTDENAGREPLTVVGMGASAGGLEAITQVLKHLPKDNGMAVVIVQHLARDHASILPELLQAETKLEVVQVTDGMRLMSGRVHVIPPDSDMTIAGGVLKLVSRPEQRVHHTPIDSFLSSLATDAQSRAVAVILSGTGSDGTIGVREIKAASGIVLVQDPESARYSGMPQAAIATGAVDAVLRPADIADELIRIAHHPLLSEPDWAGDNLLISDEQLERIHSLLRDVSGVDFGSYRQPTIRRRIQRRMILHKLNSASEYVEYLQKNRRETENLYRDVLIHVTRFFREPESFKVLAELGFPKIMETRRPNEPIRIWVPGCSTGEEAYSVAIALLEFLGDEAAHTPIQIFGTDVSEEAIEQARSGSYSAGIASDLSKERLLRFFTRTESGYRISKLVREMCVFARQDVTRDPPFSRLDLILCRNLLIYLGPSLQRRLVTLFHYALQPSRFLLLGASESIGLHSELFAVVDKRHRLFVKRPTSLRPDLEFATVASGVRQDPSRKIAEELQSGTVHKEVDRFILARYSPAAAVLDAEFQIIEVRGQTGLYLELHPGQASLNVLKMAREGLLHVLRSALAEARNSGGAVRKERVRLRSDPGVPDIDLEVIPLTGTAETRHYLVLFEPYKPPEPAEPEPEAQAGADAEATRLREELAANREYLQSIIQDLEAANEELQSANEEILSSNEELQSTNEELDTAREELQSTNEELNTVNEEL
jgi:two-component system CheB/CheR fusion protein